MTEATTNKERPILFRGDMVRAILDGRKDVTRRPVKLDMASNMDEGRGATDTAAGYPYIETDDGHVSVTKLCPYGQVGDHLWVRETFTLVEPLPDRTPTYPRAKFCTIDGNDTEVWYRADGDLGILIYCDPDGPRWKPSIHMPRAASRITLAITDIRVERLHEITEDDARREGVDSRQAFFELWDQMHSKSAFASVFNPFVWRIEFTRVTP